MKRIVLYYPKQRNDRVRPPYSMGREELPLSLLTIASWPIEDGYEVQIIDGTRYDTQTSHRRVLEACDGALLYATTGILGYQVKDGLECTRKVRERLGGVHGCTHLVELIGPMATTAFQTIFPLQVRERAKRSEHAESDKTRRPALLNTCHAYASDSEIVKRHWPDFYTGDRAAE